ncbi:MAG: hypothetical protein KC457_14610 [Myxococcales bacterium]|nr:hypothetical protein [Myxococcales bacterium]
MAMEDTAGLALLPLLGLCSCAATSADLDGWVSDSAPLVDPWREAEAGQGSPTMVEVALATGLEALAVGDYAAAEQALAYAAEVEPELAELRLAQADALIGLRHYEAAADVLATLDDEGSDQVANARELRRIDIRERERANGDGACDLTVEQERVPLPRHNEFLAAWNDIRAGLPADYDIPVPADEDEARSILCSDGECPVGEPQLVHLGDEDEEVVAMVVATLDGSLVVLPELMHVVGYGCVDEDLVAMTRHGRQLHLRAIGDDLQSFSPSDWALARATSERVVDSMRGPSTQDSNDVLSAGVITSYYGAGSYDAQGYAYNQSYAYSYSYSYGYGYDCGGGDYEYDQCQAERLVQRDMVIDLARGEVVVDVRRTGSYGSAMGRVELRGGSVSVDACGVEQSLALSWT